MKKVILSLTILIILTNCVSIRSDKYIAIKPEELKVSSIKKSKIFVDLGFDSSFFGQTNPNAINALKSNQIIIFNEIIKESDCCEIVDKKEEADIFVSGIFHNESSNVGLIFSVITGASFYTIPSWINSKMRISAEVTNNKISKSYNLDDSVFFAQWLPLVVVPIFAGNQPKVEIEVNKNLYKTLLFQIKKDGFFSKQ